MMSSGSTSRTDDSRRSSLRFARDGAIPGSKVLAKVSHRHQMPVNAFLLCVAVQVLLSCLYFGSSAAFNAFISVAVICLGTSYVIPVIISVVRGRDQLAGAKFYLGRRFGLFCNGQVARSAVGIVLDGLTWV